MKLIRYLFIRSSLALVIVLTVWSVLFYLAIIEEVNDEVDDALDNYSEYIIRKVLSDDSISNTNINTNYSFSIQKISDTYAANTTHLRYIDTVIYIESKHETEPARLSRSIFKDRNDQYYEVTVATPTIEKEDLKEAIWYWILSLYAVLLIIIIPINILIIKRSLRPLYKLIMWIDNFNIGRKNAPLNNDTSISEFSKLNHAVERSNLRQQQLYEQQKELIADVSHELQTPLAVCMNRIEIMMDDDLLSEKTLIDLHRLQNNLSTLIRLNKSLLLMSKVDNEQFSNTNNICINALIKLLVIDFEEVYSSKNIVLTIEECGDLTWNINEELLRIVLNNLMKNAFLHNVTGGFIQIKITDQVLIVKNSGINMPLNDRIFERFYIGKDKKEGSTGLGLAIVRTICKRCGLTINYQFDGNHCFTIGSGKTGRIIRN